MHFWLSKKKKFGRSKAFSRHILFVSRFCEVHIFTKQHRKEDDKINERFKNMREKNPDEMKHCMIMD